MEKDKVKKIKFVSKEINEKPKGGKNLIKHKLNPPNIN